MGQIQFTTSLIMIGLFTIAIIGFATNFAIDNNSEVSVLDDPEFSTLNNSVSTNVGSFRGASESTYQSIIESSIEQADTTPSGGQFAITPTSSVAVTKNILEVGTEIKAMEKVFQKVLPTFTSTVNELSRITGNLKKKK